MSDENMINPELLPKAAEIISILAQQRPEKSLSFVLSAEGADAVSDMIKIVAWGIGGNKPKIKATAFEVLGSINEVPSGAPVNVNLTEHEIKAMQEVLAAVEKAHERHQEGVLI